jgi:hypothetical protein
MNMPTRETGTILAALRRWQIHLESRLANSSETEELHSIATDGGSFRALAPEEIDELCESINLGDGSPANERLLGFAELVRDFFTDDSAGHARYLKDQAERALAAAQGKARSHKRKVPRPKPADDGYAVLAELDPVESEMEEKYRDGARGHVDTEFQVDADAKVSMGDDPGAWVQCWLWVTDQEAGIKQPAHA